MISLCINCVYIYKSTRTAAKTIEKLMRKLFFFSEIYNRRRVCTRHTYNMLKHVQISPLRNRSDSLSMRSSTSCASSLCGSPEPSLTDQLRPVSRASSYCSLNETVPQVSLILLLLLIFS